MSDIFVFYVALDINCNNYSSISFLERNNSLLQSRLHLTTTLLFTDTHLPTSRATPSLFNDIEYNLGDFCLSDKSPTHLSSQKIMCYITQLLSYPTIKPIMIIPLSNFHLILLLHYPKIKTICIHIIKYHKNLKISLFTYINKYQYIKIHIH